MPVSHFTAGKPTNTNHNTISLGHGCRNIPYAACSAFENLYLHIQHTKLGKTRTNLFSLHRILSQRNCDSWTREAGIFAGDYYENMNTIKCTD